MTDTDLTERARDLAFADYVYCVGETGVMAANPDLLRDAFDRSWNAGDATAEAMRERWLHIARAADRIAQSERDAAAAKARRAALDFISELAALREAIAEADPKREILVRLGGIADKVKALASPTPQEER